MTVAGVHDRYPGLLGVLASDDAVLQALGCAGPGWRREVGRVSLSGPLATLVFQRSDPAGRPGAVLVVDAHLERPDAARDAVELAGGEATAWLVRRPFPEDPWLPQLPELLDGPGRREVVRYRPGVRCTVRVQEDGVTRYAKVFRDPDGEALHRDLVALWHAAQQGNVGFAVAEPQPFDPATGIVWQGEISGGPVGPVLSGDGGVELAARMGRALATLPVAGVRPARAGGPEQAMRRTLRTAGALSRHVPALGPAVASVVERIERIHVAAGPRPGRPIHGAARHPQWLIRPDGLGLVDFDRFGLGDLEAEVAAFEVGVEGERRSPDGLAEAFRSGYEDSSGPLDGRLLGAHRAAARLRMARRMAQQMRADAPARARERVEAAARGLEEIGA
jgi:hypothetical protein